jgi:mono/diheme cytochrome c family protein
MAKACKPGRWGAVAEPNKTRQINWSYMKRIVAVLTVLVAGAALTASAADGKALYTKECAKCHGADGKGQTTMGKKLKAKDYSDPKVQEAIKDEAMAKAIKDGFKDKDGKVAMKPMPNLSDDDVNAIVKYMRSLKK